MPNYDVNVLMSLGSQAASACLDDGVPLEDTIEKMAREKDLNPHQIQRVCEFANHRCLVELTEGAGADKTAEIPHGAADVRRVCERLNAGEVNREKEAELIEFEPPPRALMRFEVPKPVSPSPHVDKTAAEEKDEDALDLAELLEYRKQLRKHAFHLDVKADRAYEEVKRQVKGLLEMGRTFGEIKYACLQFHPEATDLFDKLAEDLNEAKDADPGKGAFKRVKARHQLILSVGDYVEAIENQGRNTQAVDEAEKKIKQIRKVL